MSKAKVSMSRIAGLSLIVLLLGSLGFGLTALQEKTNLKIKASNTKPDCEDLKSIQIESCGKVGWIRQTNKCKTEKRNVQLTLDSAGAKQMRFKEIEPKTTCVLTDATGWSAWENYATKKDFKLSGGYGNKKVCVTFKNDLGESKCGANIKNVKEKLPKQKPKQEEKSEEEKSVGAIKRMYTVRNDCEGGDFHIIDRKYYNSLSGCINAISPIRYREWTKGNGWNYKWAVGKCNPLSSSSSYEWHCGCDCLDDSCSNCN